MTMTIGDIITSVGLIVGFIVQAALLLTGAAIAWGRVRGTVDQLTESIRNLTTSVEKLDAKLDNHAERLARLEGRRS